MGFYIRNFWKFTRIFCRHHEWQMGLLVLGGILMSFLEFIGISTILPLLMLIIQPDVALQNGYTHYLYQLFDARNPERLAMILGLCVAMLFIGKNVFQAFYWRFEFSLLAKWRTNIITRLYDAYLHVDYEVFMQRNSSHVINMLTKVVSLTIAGFVHPMLALVNYMLTGLVILSYIVYINWLAAVLIITTGIILFVSYTSIIRKRARQMGQDVVTLSLQQYSLLQQSLAGYKETRAHSKESYFSKAFLATADKFSEREEGLLYLRSLPPAIVELTAMLLLLVIFLVIFYTGNDMHSAVTQLGVIVLACTRMLPMINRSISALTGINSTRDTVQELFHEADMLHLKETEEIGKKFANETEVSPLPFRQELVLKDVSYRYPNKEGIALDNINFSIKPGEFIGITGPSGSGKSTLVNILMGYLKSTTGSFTVDDTPITADTLSSFRQIIGYVDQQVFVLDATIAENVAFGVPLPAIDKARVIAALEKAQLWDFVQTLPQGLETLVGENGKSLSGGQRQRLAIARALYRDLKILILDEASASLDVETEHKLFSILHQLKGSMAVIMIAHRLSTLQNCDRLYFMEDGRMVDAGNFDVLYKQNATFKRYIDYSQLPPSSKTGT